MSPKQYLELIEGVRFNPNRYMFSQNRYDRSWQTGQTGAEDIARTI
ncbi:MAG: hypothetical protein K8U03_00635 [Planctomycetia bacterium]|nr:hypothetical protein [Planctomycetia bacterium]